MNDSIDFTDRERFVLSYYRDPGLFRWQRHAALEGALVLVSLCFLALDLIQHDRVWGFVAYALLIWRTCASVWRSRQYMETFRSIIKKYDDKVSELTGASDPAKA
jgi:hypothetical protein